MLYVKHLKRQTTAFLSDASMCNLHTADWEELRMTTGRQYKPKCYFSLCAVHHIAVPVKYWIDRKTALLKETKKMIEKDESCYC